MENNSFQNKLSWAYLVGFFIILALPLFNLPPWLYPTDWGKAIAFRSILAILLFVFLYGLLGKKGLLMDNLNVSDTSETFKKSKIILALASLFIVFLLASIFSVDPYFSFWGSPYRGGGFVTFAFYFVFAILTFILFKKPAQSPLGNEAGGDDWKNAWIISIIIGILVSLIALFQFYGLFGNIFVSVSSRPGSTIGNPIFLGIYILLLFFATLSFAINEKNKKWKIFYIISLLIFLYVIAITGSRAAYFGLIAGGLYFLLAYPVRKSEQSGMSDLSKKNLVEKYSDQSSVKISTDGLSNGAYPKKMKIIKIASIVFLILIIGIIFYANTANQFPKVIEQNRIFNSVISRLSLKNAFNNERYRAWETVFKEIEDKPILGWGPENLAVGFDKNYDPNITWSPWWDKAHNIFLDIGAQAGILGILAYIALFFTLFWTLHKTKHRAENETTRIIITGIQATLIGYLVANFFSFDSVPTYLLFFFIIGYSLHLTEPKNISGNQPLSAKIKEKEYKQIKGGGIIIGIILIILVIFLWQYNIVPFYINTKINIANNWVNQQKKCDSGLALMEKLATQHSFIDSYLRMQYIDDLKKCSAINPDKNLEYAKTGFEMLKDAVKIHPTYTRFWIYLGSFETVIANNEQNPQTRQDMLNEAYSYFDKAETLAPLHQGILIEKAKTDMVAGDYQKMKQNAQKCIDIKPDIGDCYWEKSLAELYMNDQQNAEKDSQLAKKYGFNVNSINAYFQLIDVYIENEQYDKLAGVYEILVRDNPEVAQYHSSLALAYSKLGEYKKAREQALKFLELMPEAKEEVEAFLRTLPY